MADLMPLSASAPCTDVHTKSITHLVRPAFGVCARPDCMYTTYNSCEGLLLTRHHLHLWRCLSSGLIAGGYLSGEHRASHPCLSAVYIPPGVSRTIRHKSQSWFSSTYWYVPRQSSSTPISYWDLGKEAHCFEASRGKRLEHCQTSF